jgi:transcriptional regulator
MYVPDAFRLEEREALLGYVTAYPFATVVTQGEGGLGVSHLPLLVGARGDVLRGHLARENQQLGHLAAGAEALAIFHGPHGYVSPSVYAVQPSVPTWNYVVVHVRGRAQLVGTPELRAILDEAVARFDTTGWQLDQSDAFLGPKLEAIAGFEIAIDELLGKVKMSQNRSSEDQGRVATWLEQGDPSARALAALMRARS